MKHVSRQTALTTAVLALIALFSTACGGSTAVTASAEREFAIEVAPIAEPAQSDAEPAQSNAEPSSAGGHQYGATIDEWTQIEQQQQGANNTENTEVSAAGSSEYPTIAWEDLIPVGASGEELIARFEERLDAVEPGSEEADLLYTELQAEWNPEAVDPLLDGQKIRLAGFVAPLTYADDIITEFLLVPTFGACIHVPPPPANQTVMVSVDEEFGLTFEESWGAVWVEGTMQIESATTDLGATSYRIIDATSGPYTGV